MNDHPTATQAEPPRAQPPTAVDEIAHQPALWNRVQLAGRLAELSSWGNGAPLTLAFELVLQSQHEGEPAVWITTPEGTFYPPDVARCGIDLDALPVVRTPDGRSAARAADKLVRSGAFGLVVVDLGTHPPIPLPLQSRLLGLVDKHQTALLFLTEKQRDSPSIGSLVSLRAQAARRQTAENRFACDMTILKDKRRGPGWTHMEVRHGPAGLR